MGTTLVPYSQAMRLGQACEAPCGDITQVLINSKGYNTYLQQICIDRAVTFVREAIQTGVPSSHNDVKPGPKSDNCIIQEAALDDIGTPRVCVCRPRDQRILA